MKLKNKVGLVTGAGQGIGKAIALAFADEGCVVIVNDINRETAKATAKEIIGKGAKAIALQADVSNKSEVDRLVQTVVGQVGRIDILVNNVGVQTLTPFLDLSEEEWDIVINTNLKSTFLCSQIVARQMVKGGGGKIINISSIHQSLPRKKIAHYAASKGGIAMLTKVMALELAQYKINVVSIAPGAVATPMNEKIIKSAKKRAEFSSKIPWRDIAKPSEVAQLAVYLASQDAQYITGSTFYIDGGLTLAGYGGS